MPIYEFYCTDCHRDSELLVRTAQWKGTRCSHCGSLHLAKKLSIFASVGASNGNDICAEAGTCQRNPETCHGCCGGEHVH